MKTLEDYKPGDRVLVKEFDAPTWHEGIVEEYDVPGSRKALVGRYVVKTNGFDLWERDKPEYVLPLER